MFLYKLFALLFLLSTVFAEDPLLKISTNSECIKGIIDSFIKKQTCHKLSQQKKVHLAISMTNCLNLKLGKSILPQCNDITHCDIRGDDWNTFTTFYTHIDNLCHFYWDLLYHQRTESLIGGLSQSAYEAQNILKKNFETTQKILEVQETINLSMSQSLKSNQRLSDSLKKSQIKIQNMTTNIQEFLGQLNKNLLSQYSSIIKVMSTINEGVEGMNGFQKIMISQIYSISGMLYFLSQIFIIGLLTSFSSFRKNRPCSFLIYTFNILVELLVPDFILLLIGIKIIRLLFVFLHLLNFFKSFTSKEENFNQMKTHMDRRLDTKRIKRIFKELIQEGKAIQNKAEIIQED